MLNALLIFFVGAAPPFEVRRPLLARGAVRWWSGPSPWLRRAAALGLPTHGVRERRESRVAVVAGLRTAMGAWIAP